MLVLCLLLQVFLLDQVTVSLGLGEGNEALSKLVQEVSHNRHVYHQSLERLNDHLAALRTPPTEDVLLRAKRNSLGRIEDSLMAFCQTLLNVPEANSSSSSTPQPQGGTTMPEGTNGEDENSSKWRTPMPKIEPIAVSVKKFEAFSLVEFKVRHSVSGFVSPMVTWKMDLGEVKRRQRLKVRRKDTVPKISKVGFKVNTAWCSKYPNKPEVSFSFVMRNIREPTITLAVQVCKTNEQGGEPMTTTEPPFLAELPVKSIFRYNLTNEDLKVKRGENITMVVEFEVPEGNKPRLFVMVNAWSFNHRTGNMSASTIFSSYDSFGPNGQFYINSRNPSKFVRIEEVNDPISTSMPTSANDTKSEMPAKKVAYLKVTFNVASGEDTGIVEFYQGTHSYDGDVETVGMNLPLLITREGESEPMPAESVFVMGENQFCNTNKMSDAYRYDGGDCILRCNAVGQSVKSLEIIKEGVRNVGRLVQQSLAPGFTSAVLRVDTSKPSSGGNYTCRAKTRTGSTFTYNIELVVAGLPAIDKNNTQVTNLDTGKAAIACSATGSDVQISILREAYQEEFGNYTTFPIDGEYPSQAQREDEAVSLTVTVPLQEAENYEFTHICNASSIYGYSVHYYNRL